jgi:hypothetical protein
MADHTRNALTGICNTLTDIVGPGVSAENPLAQQELRMAVRYLGFLQQRVDHLHARARFELRHYCELASALRQLSADSDQSLADLTARARGLLASPDVSSLQLSECAGQLADAVSRIVGQLDDQADPAVRRDTERAVVRDSAGLTVFERAWYLPLGMDHFGGELPPLETFLYVPITSGSHV